jgi:hypothetical protein
MARSFACRLIGRVVRRFRPAVPNVRQHEQRVREQHVFGFSADAELIDYQDYH